jgi:hypothetical protein
MNSVFTEGKPRINWPQQHSFSLARAGLSSLGVARENENDARPLLSCHHTSNTVVESSYGHDLRRLSIAGRKVAAEP